MEKNHRKKWVKGLDRHFSKEEMLGRQRSGGLWLKASLGK
jgi:hypothetical protein